MYLEIYRDYEKVNIFKDCHSSFIANLFVVAHKTNNTKMKVVNHMDGTATVKFYIEKGFMYVYRNVPYHAGYIDESSIYNEIYKEV